MEEAHHVMLCPETVSLLGVKQFYQELPGAPSLATQQEIVSAVFCVRA